MRALLTSLLFFPLLVFTQNSWQQLGQDIDGEAENDMSGISVSLSSNGTRVAIGAYGNDGNGEYSGHVRLYDYDSNSTSWSPLGVDITGDADEEGGG